MATLDNSNQRLLEGLVLLLRDKVSGWSTNSEYNVDNVWSKNVPDSAKDEFPRGSVDTISGDDTDLSVELDVSLREVSVRFVVFAETSDEAEDLINKVEDAVSEHWDSTANSTLDSWSTSTYTGDWSKRELDGQTPLSEDSGSEGQLRYNRSKDIIFETVKTTR